MFQVALSGDAAINYNATIAQSPFPAMALNGFLNGMLQLQLSCKDTLEKVEDCVLTNFKFNLSQLDNNKTGNALWKQEITVNCTQNAALPFSVFANQLDTPKFEQFFKCTVLKA